TTRRFAGADPRPGETTRRPAGADPGPGETTRRPAGADPGPGETTRRPAGADPGPGGAGRGPAGSAVGPLSTRIEEPAERSRNGWRRIDVPHVPQIGRVDRDVREDGPREAPGDGEPEREEEPHRPCPRDPSPSCPAAHLMQEPEPDRRSPD